MKKIFVLFAVMMLFVVSCNKDEIREYDEGYYYNIGGFYFDEAGNVMAFDTPYGKISEYAGVSKVIKKGNGYIYSDAIGYNSMMLDGTVFKNTEHDYKPYINSNYEIVLYEDLNEDEKLGYKKIYDLNYNVVNDYVGYEMEFDLNDNIIMHKGTWSSYVGYIIGENLTKMINEIIKCRFYDGKYYDGYVEVLDNMTDKEYMIIWNGTDTIVYNKSYEEVTRVNYVCKDYKISNDRIIFVSTNDERYVYNINSKSFKEYDVDVLVFYDDNNYISSDCYYYQNNVKTNLRCDYDSFISSLSNNGIQTHYGKYINSFYLNDEEYVYQYDVDSLEVKDYVLIMDDVCIDVKNSKLITMNLDGKNYIASSDNYYINLKNGCNLIKNNSNLYGFYDVINKEFTWMFCNDEKMFIKELDFSSFDYFEYYSVVYKTYPLFDVIHIYDYEGNYIKEFYSTSSVKYNTKLSYCYKKYNNIITFMDNKYNVVMEKDLNDYTGGIIFNG